MKLERAQKVGVPLACELTEADVYVDEFLGAGLNRPLDAFT